MTNKLDYRRVKMFSIYTKCLRTLDSSCCFQYSWPDESRHRSSIICLHEIIAKPWYSLVCESRAIRTLNLHKAKPQEIGTLQRPHLKTHPTHAKHSFYKMMTTLTWKNVFNGYIILGINKLSRNKCKLLSFTLHNDI